MIYLISTRPVVEVIFSLGFKGVSAVRGNFICSVNSLSPLCFGGIALQGRGFHFSLAYRFSRVWKTISPWLSVSYLDTSRTFYLASPPKHTSSTWNLCSILWWFSSVKRHLWTLSLNYLASIYSASVCLVEVYEFPISLSQKNSVLVVPSGDCLNFSMNGILVFPQLPWCWGWSSRGWALTGAISALLRGWENLAPVSVLCFVKLQ